MLIMDYYVDYRLFFVASLTMADIVILDMT